MTSAVLFDLMGTVVHDPYVEALKAATGLDVAAAQARKDPECWPLFEISAIDEIEFARRFFTDAGVLDLEAFHRVRREGYRYLEGMRELLQALEGRVARYVASNYPVWIEDLSLQLGLDEHFEGIWASCHLGVRKPDPEFFRLLLAGIGHDAADCLFVDDRAVNCEAAEAVGVRAHLFDGAAGLAEHLRAEGLLPPAP